MRKVLLLSERAEDDCAVRRACHGCGLTVEVEADRLAGADAPLAIFFDASRPAALSGLPRAFRIGLVDRPLAGVDLFAPEFDGAVWFLRPLDPVRIEHGLRYLLTQISCEDQLQVVLDAAACAVTIHNRSTPLTAPQSDVLQRFAKSGPNTIVRFEDFGGRASDLLPSIAFLRGLFADAGFHDAITTVPKVGYRLRSDIQITC
ncbi:MAG: hypothetical protein LW852_13750 [Sediminibacterium sp.]|jgi:hypothetical protein|nr:hypothetical protein [Sediminibacterium sp.]